MNRFSFNHFASLTKALAVASLVSVSVTGCTISVNEGAENRQYGISLKTTVGSGNLATEPRTVVAFDSVEVKDGIRLNLRKGSEQKVTVSADDNVLPLVEVNVKGSSLVLRMKANTNIRTKDPIIVNVDYLTLEKLTVRDGASVDADALAATNFALQVKDGSSLRAVGLSAAKLDVSVSDGASAKLASARGGDSQSFKVSDGATLAIDAVGGGAAIAKASDGATLSMQSIDLRAIDVTVADGASANLSGAATQQVFTVSDGASVNARQLQGESARGKVKDGATLRAGALKSIDVEVDESATVRYDGDPLVTIRSTEKMNVKKY